MTTHEEQLKFLKRIEGQVRGVQKMIADGRYCIDIITQIHAIIGAMYSVENKILKKHIDGCVATALQGDSELEKHNKINEIMDLFEKFRKI